MLPTTARFAYLDGVRAFAVLAVLGIHWGTQYTPLGGGGFIGVDVFFVLSGFVITTALWRSRLDGGSVPRAWAAFVARRARRLYPALLGLCLLGPLLWLVAPGAPLPIGTVVERAALSAVQLTWVPEMNGTVAEPFRQTWSLGIEWLFYLTWPVAVMVAGRRGWTAERLARAALTTAAVLYVVPAVTLSWRAFYFLPLPRFSEILVGAALSLWHVGHRPVPAERRPRQTIVLAGALVALAAYVAVGDRLPVVTARFVVIPVAVATTALLIHHAYAATGGPLHDLLGHRLVAGLGRASYSLYLWHWLPLYLLDKDEIDLPAPVLAVVGVGLVAVLTWLSHTLLEKPFLRPRGDVLLPHRPTGQPQTT